mmetsp:Transcript_13533/g.39191  ORF Transcript_13533/g.39191 Transcript_13533/m.39191 type:complete len:372 (+) Transcript_13533:190-1305(+)
MREAQVYASHNLEGCGASWCRVGHISLVSPEACMNVSLEGDGVQVAKLGGGWERRQVAHESSGGAGNAAVLSGDLRLDCNRVAALQKRTRGGVELLHDKPQVGAVGVVGDHLHLGGGKVNLPCADLVVVKRVVAKHRVGAVGAQRAVSARWVLGSKYNVGVVVGPRLVGAHAAGLRLEATRRNEVGTAQHPGLCIGELDGVLVGEGHLERADCRGRVAEDVRRRAAALGPAVAATPGRPEVHIVGGKVNLHAVRLAPRFNDERRRLDLLHAAPDLVGPATHVAECQHRVEHAQVDQLACRDVGGIGRQRLRERGADHLCDLPHPVWVILGRGAAAQHASGSVAVGNGREVAETTVRWTRKARDRNGLPVAD